MSAANISQPQNWVNLVHLFVDLKGIQDKNSVA